MLIHEPWAKIPRLVNEKMTITEKIDGTNGCIVILPFDPEHSDMAAQGYARMIGDAEGSIEPVYLFAVQSRKRFIKPGKDTDNAGFAQWAFENSEALVDTLGFGKHYGEWWGRGIQRGYGMNTKKFSLFNPWRYEEKRDMLSAVKGLDIVPTLYQGAVEQLDIDTALFILKESGSKASGNGWEAEGIIVQYALAQSTYKAFIDDDGIPKSLKEGN